jgi:23S rRNA G2069 N7-methylase RlmK/C1962 C5-methylase RlmI
MEVNERDAEFIATVVTAIKKRSKARQGENQNATVEAFNVGELTAMALAFYVSPSGTPVGWSEEGTKKMSEAVFLLLVSGFVLRAATLDVFDKARVTQVIQKASEANREGAVAIADQINKLVDGVSEPRIYGGSLH